MYNMLQNEVEMVTEDVQIQKRFILKSLQKFQYHFLRG